MKINFNNTIFVEKYKNRKLNENLPVTFVLTQWSFTIVTRCVIIRASATAAAAASFSGVHLLVVKSGPFARVIDAILIV